MGRAGAGGTVDAEAVAGGEGTVVEENEMKIAITVNGDGLDAPVDPRFGRARKFLVVDSETLACQAVDNSQNLEAPQGAGIQAAKTIADLGAEVLLTGHCGPNAFKALQAAGIAVHVGATGTARQALEAFGKGVLKAATAADKEGHW